MRITTKDVIHNLDNISNSIYLRGKSFLLFDIETTGFSRENDIIYMIGCIFKTDSGYQYDNIFAQIPSQESEVIKYFFNLLENIDCIIHFNGNRFDIPFLLARAAKHHIKDTISPIESIDIYDLLRSFRPSLRFPNLKLDTIQDQLGYKRRDSNNGGELIQIYHNYAEKPYEPYYDLLLLHNEEDVEGMINLLPLIDVIYSINEIIKNKRIEFLETDQDGNHIRVIYALPHKAFVNLKLFTTCNAQLTFKAYSHKVELLLPVHTASKKFFFNNYKDYMVVTLNNEVMHKTVANFIPKDSKRRAKKAECYVSHTGTFIPIFLSGFNKDLDLRIFKEEVNSRDYYVIASTELGKDFYESQISGFLRKCKGLK